MKKKIILSWLLVLGVMVTMAQSPDGLPLKLRVGSYNVGHFNQGMKGGLEVKGREYYPNNKEVTSGYIKKELQRWKKWIGEQSLDIFAVQEWNYYFDRDSMFIAGDELLKPYYNHIYFGEAHSWIYNGIATNYKLTNLRKKYWFQDYYALIGDLKIGSQAIQVISMHIPWQKEGHAAALDSIISELKKYKYFICFGDTNASDAEILNFVKSGFNIANGGPQGWFPTSSTVILDRMTDGPDRHIDNIITSKNIKIMKVSAPHTTLNDQDHLPVLADVIITW